MPVIPALRTCQPGWLSGPQRAHVLLQLRRRAAALELPPRHCRCRQMLRRMYGLHRRAHALHSSVHSVRSSLRSWMLGVAEAARQSSCLQPAWVSAGLAAADGRLREDVGGDSSCPKLPRRMQVAGRRQHGQCP